MMQDHLFISYAWEDGALADWLTRKLIAEGFRVWCDRFKLLGGESYPQDIDEAIKHRTFRVLALLSRHSLNKPNPVKERTLALTLARERKNDFLIPLNVDGLSPGQLNWMVSDLVFVPFSSWGDGFAQLLKKLDALNAPRPLSTNGREIAASTYLQEDVIFETPEVLVSNQFSFLSMPEEIGTFELKMGTSPAKREALKRLWAFYSLGDDACLALSRPPTDFPIEPILIASHGAMSAGEIHGVDTRNVLSFLLGRELDCHLLRKGLVKDIESGLTHFPWGFGRSGRVSYPDDSGRTTSIKVVGERSYRGAKYRYYLAPRFQTPRRLIDREAAALLRLQIFITDPSGKLFQRRSMVARRKALARAWFNREWLSRQRALMHFARTEPGQIALPSLSGELRLSTNPLVGVVPRSINDAGIAAARNAFVVPLLPEADEDADVKG